LGSLFSENEFVETVILFSKFLMTVLTYIYLRKLFSLNIDVIPQIDRVININFIVVLFNRLIMGITGLGFASYEGENLTTSKGFFYSGNELSALTIILFSYMIFKSYSAKWKYRRLFLLLLLITAFYAGSKTMIIGTIILCLLIPKITVSTKKRSIAKKTLKIIIFTLIATLIIIGGYHFLVSTGVWNRWVFFYEKYGTASIFSGRLDFVSEEIMDYVNAPLLFKLMGLGGFRTVEMDFFDVLLNFGIFGIFAVYFFYLFVLENARRLKSNKNYPFAKLSFITLILVLCISFLAGHTIFSGGGMFIGIICALVFFNRQTQNLH
jgi:hypothetical protein